MHISSCLVRWCDCVPIRRPYALELDDGTVIRGHTVVLATGARYRSLALADIARFEGAGVHYAATAVEAALCDGEEAIVVGGGNSAGQEPVFLSRHAAHVHIVVRGAGLASTMSEYLVSPIKAAPERITVHPHTEIAALIGDRHVDAVTWRNRLSGESQTRNIPNVFLYASAPRRTPSGSTALSPWTIRGSCLRVIRSVPMNLVGHTAWPIRWSPAAQASSPSAMCDADSSNGSPQPWVTARSWWPQYTKRSPTGESTPRHLPLRKIQRLCLDASDRNQFRTELSTDKMLLRPFLVSEQE